MKFLFSFFLFFAFSQVSFAQAIQPIADTTLHNDTAKIFVVKPINNYGNLLDSSTFLNFKEKPESLQTYPNKNIQNNNLLFYILAIVFLFFGLVRSFYDKYFTTMFRVFFNTTLKQNQLTDQLVQSKLPSLFFNGLFIAAAGLYIFILLQIFNGQKVQLNKHNITQLLYAVLLVFCCYLVKYLVIRLLGWLTNHKSEANSYIFIIFLLNKIMGIFLLCLIPFIFYIKVKAGMYIVFASLIVVLLLFILRYYRSFSILNSRLQLNFLSLLLFIITLEGIPFALIFKFCSQILITKP